MLHIADMFIFYTCMPSTCVRLSLASRAAERENVQPAWAPCSAEAFAVLSKANHILCYLGLDLVLRIKAPLVDS